MSTIVNQAVSAIVAALQASPAVVASVGRVSLRPVAQASAQAIIVRPVQSEAAYAGDIGFDPTSWTTTVAVECYARASGATAPDVAVDDLLQAAYARLAADPTLGGAVLAMYPQQVAYDFDADGEKTACATLVFSVMHSASSASLV